MDSINRRHMEEMRGILNPDEYEFIFNRKWQK
jgi:hypothetical protein